MCPSGIGLDKSDGDKGRSDEQWNASSEEGTGNQQRKESQEEPSGKTTEQRSPAANGANGAVHAADRGGDDRRWRCESSGCVFGRKAIFSNGYAIVVQRDAFVSRRRRVLDDGKGWID